MPAAPVKFAYWVPDVSGGPITSKIEQRTDWGYGYNRELAVLTFPTRTCNTLNVPTIQDALRAAPPGLHDPVAYKRREVGRWVLEGELPEPTWYF